jgi:hypothetical protein
VERNMRIWEESIYLNLKEKSFDFALNSAAKTKGPGFLKTVMKIFA